MPVSRKWIGHFGIIGSPIYGIGDSEDEARADAAKTWNEEMSVGEDYYSVNPALIQCYPASDILIERICDLGGDQEWGIRENGIADLAGDSYELENYMSYVHRMYSVVVEDGHLFSDANLVKYIKEMLILCMHPKSFEEYGSKVEIEES